MPKQLETQAEDIAELVKQLQQASANSPIGPARDDEMEKDEGDGPKLDTKRMAYLAQEVQRAEAVRS